MPETGLGRGDDQRQDARNRLVDKLDKEQNPNRLAALISRAKDESTSPITGAPEVVAAVKRAENRLPTL